MKPKNNNFHLSYKKSAVVFLILLVFLSACQSKNINVFESYPSVGISSKMYSYEEILWPTQPGEFVFESNGYIVDYSNSEYGYISILAPNNDSIQKAQVTLNENVYTYTLDPNEYVIIPLQMGDGIYSIKLLRNKEGNTYVVSASTQIDVKLINETTVYLYPNQIVNYDKETQAIMKSFELTQEADSEIERVYEIYQYIINTIDYDYDKAELAQTKFILPIIDETYSIEKGICFDYASLMSAMLRVQHIPTRVVTGYVDLGYHAWVEVYIKDKGWINPSIYFESDIWKRVDPTFDSMGSYDGDYQDQDYY
jgi:transglutaminase-like putative cysteine protease